MSLGSIARIYDRFTDPEAYEAWLNFTLNTVPFEPQKALDLGCGTGMFPQLLSFFVAEVVGLDLDEEMLAIGREEAGTEASLTYVQGDMTNFDLPAKDFDLVTSYADSLCFLAGFDQVAQTFERVYAHLRPGGYFLFDLWTPYQLSQGFEGFSYFDTDEAGALMWDSEITGPLEVTHYLTVFEKEDQGEAYRRIETQVSERTYDFDQVVAALEAAGFGQVGCWVDFGAATYDSSRHPRADRWFFQAVKE